MGADAGHVRIFEWDGVDWQQRGDDIDAEAAGDWAGHKVDISKDGNVVIVGAPLNSANGGNAGQARVFEWNSGTGAWDQVGQDIVGSAGDHLGQAVAISANGQQVVVGSPHNDTNGGDSGNIQIFDYDNISNEWKQVGTTTPGLSAGDRFGMQLSMSDLGATVIAGSRGNAGEADVFRLDGGLIGSNPPVSASIEIDLTVLAPTIEALPPTSNQTPTITGAGEPGATVTISADVDLDGSGSTETLIGSSIVDSNGMWSVVSTETLPEGVVSLSAIQTDEAGNVSGATASSVEIDLTVNVPTINLLAVTNDRTPTITGTGEAGATVTLLADTDADGNGADVQIGQAVVQGNGTWSITSSATFAENATIALSATQTDEAGATSNAVVSSIEIDTSVLAPAINPSAVTNDQTPEITGTGEPGATVTLLADTDADGTGADVQIGQAVVQGDGTWSVASNETLPEGVIALSATQADEAGSVSVAAASSIEIDLTVLAPTIDVLAVTNNQTPAITGTGEPGATVTVLADTDAVGGLADVQVGQAVVDGDGNWSITSSETLSEGTIALSATQTDEAGNGPSAASAAASIEIDLTVLAATIDVLAVTNNQNPTITGTGEVGATVTVVADVDLDGVPESEITDPDNRPVVAGDGTWSLVSTQPLLEGTVALSATQIDQVGNGPSVASAAASIEIDLTVDAPIIDPLPETNNKTPTISGVGEVNATVVVLVDNEVVGTSVVAGDGTWSVIPPSDLDEGELGVVAYQTDEAGNISAAASDFLTIDATAPAPPLVDPLGPTDDTTPTITGVGAAGATVTARADLEGDPNGVDGIPETIIGTATVGVDGTWSVESTETLPPQDVTVSFVLEDAVGNVSDSTVVQLSIRGEPELPLFTGPTNPGSGEFVTTTTQPIISGTGDPGHLIRLRMNGSDLVDGTDDEDDDGEHVDTTVGWAVVDGAGDWSIDLSLLTPSFNLPTGTEPNGETILFSATQVDELGNEGAPQDQTIRVDGFSPENPEFNNLDEATGSIGVVNSQTPEITGTGEAGARVTVRRTSPSIVLGNATVQENGTWSVTSSETLAAGVVSLSITQIDTAGNSSGTSLATLEIDLLAPAAPTVNALLPTRDRSPYLDGTGEVGATVVVTADIDLDGTAETNVGTATVDSEGNWGFLPNQQFPAAGTFPLEVVQTDIAGNQSPAGSGSVEINPAAGPARPLLVTGSQSDIIRPDVFPTNLSNPTIHGLGFSGATVTVELDSNADGSYETPLGTTTVTGVRWQLTYDSTTLAPNSSYSIRYTQQVAGAAASPPNFGSIELDTAPPSAPTSNQNTAESNLVTGTSHSVSSDWGWAGVVDDAQVFSVAEDSTGAVYTAGTFSGTIDLDFSASESTLTSAGADDIFVAKYDSGGTFVWAKQLGSTGRDKAYTITIDQSDNLRIGGFFEGSVDFDPGVGTDTLTSAGAGDGYVLSLDADGNYLWAGRFGGVGTGSANGDGDFVNTIAVDGSGNTYVGGVIYQESVPAVDVEFGTGSTTVTGSGQQNTIIVKIDAAGDMLWAKHFDSGFLNGPSSMAINTNGDIVIGGGLHSQPMDADPDPVDEAILNHSGLSDAYIVVLDEDGDYLWAYEYGTAGEESIKGVATDASGNIYVNAGISGSVDLDPDPVVEELFTAVGSYDLVVVSFDSDGDYRWSESYGDASAQYGWGMTINGQDELVVSGLFEGSLTLPAGSSVSAPTSIGTGLDNFVLWIDPADGSPVKAISLGTSVNDGEKISVESVGTDGILVSGWLAGAGIVDFSPDSTGSNINLLGGGAGYVMRIADVDSALAGTPTDVSSTQVFTGNGEAGTTVTLYANLVADVSNAPETVIGTTIADDDGNWSVQTNQVLPLGIMHLGVAQTDLAGNTSDSLLFYVNVIAADPTIDSFVPTSDIRPTITGTGEPNTSVTLFADTDADSNGADDQIGTATVGADGVWSITSAVDFADGTNIALSVTQEPSGNTTATATGTITIDTVPPSAPVITQFSAPQNTTLPVFSGTGAIGHQVSLSVDLDQAGAFETEIGTATVDGEGEWSLPSNTFLPEGTYNVLAVEVDSAGLVSNPGSQLEFTIDRTVFPPVFEPFALSTETQPTISGQGKVGATVTVLADVLTLMEVPESEITDPGNRPVVESDGNVECCFNGDAYSKCNDCSFSHSDRCSWQRQCTCSFVNFNRSRGTPGTGH